MRRANGQGAPTYSFRDGQSKSCCRHGHEAEMESVRGLSE